MDTVTMDNLWMLVGGWGKPLWKIWVTWDDYIPNISGKIQVMFQTTNQGCSGLPLNTLNIARKPKLVAEKINTNSWDLGLGSWDLGTLGPWPSKQKPLDFSSLKSSAPSTLVPGEECGKSLLAQEEAESNRKAETKTDQPTNHTIKQTSKRTNNQRQYILESCRIIL